MAHRLDGLYLADATDLVLVSTALSALEERCRRDGNYLPPRGLALRSLVDELLGRETRKQTDSRHESNRQGNRQDAPTPPGAKVMSVKAAASVLDRTPQAIRKAIHANRLDGTLVDGVWIVAGDSVTDTLNRRNATRP